MFGRLSDPYGRPGDLARIQETPGGLALMYLFVSPEFLRDAVTQNCCFCLILVIL